MPVLSELTRTLLSASRAMREGGIGRVTALARSRADVELKLFAARKTESVTLDGCTFSLKRIPHGRMKLGLLMGTYEQPERTAVLKRLDPGLPVVELGGCIGVVACITNKILKNPSLHVVVEANPNLVPILEENRICNHCEFEVVNAALAYNQRDVTFYLSTDFRGGSIQHQKRGMPVSVGTTCLRDIVGKRGFGKFSLICDIEGFESDLVLNEADILAKADTVILETHPQLVGETRIGLMLNTLKELGFRHVDEDSSVLVMKQSAA